MNSLENIISSNPVYSDQRRTSSTNFVNKVGSANDLFSKEKDPVVSNFLKLLKDTPSEDSITLLKIHLNLMKFYYKNSKADATYFQQSSYHAKEALLKGDLSGMAAYRLIANLSKEKRIHQAIEVFELMTDPAFHFSPNGQKKKPEFDFMLKKLERKVKTDVDPNKRLFNDKEGKMIVVNSKKQY